MFLPSLSFTRLIETAPSPHGLCVTRDMFKHFGPDSVHATVEAGRPRFWVDGSEVDEAEFRHEAERRGFNVRS